MDHDMSGMTMTTGTTATGTAAAAAATSSSMSMSMGMGGSGCKISMLWNWNTVDSCFISSSWHITSEGMFAGSCIGVILLVMSLEMLRRACKEYDRYLIRQHAASRGASTPSVADAESAQIINKDGGNSPPATVAAANACPAASSIAAPFKPNIFQQALRALLHMLQFAVAYFVMLLAMYYNGYLIICIFIGSYLGYFVFGWETLASGLVGQTSAANEATVCCG